jgi:hypothetical protein
MSIDRWMDKQNVVLHMMERNSGLKREEILIHATTRVRLEDIALIEISQSQRISTHHSHLHRDRSRTAPGVVMHLQSQHLGGGGSRM